MRAALDRSRGGLSRSYDHGINTAAIAAHRILRYDRHITNKATEKRKSREKGKGKGKGKENAADQDEDDEVERGGQVSEADWKSAPALDPTPEELETHDQDGTLLDPTEHSLCLWVGMHPSDASSFRSQRAPVGKNLVRSNMLSIVGTPHASSRSSTPTQKPYES
jgi:hypothetical protein